MRRRMRQLCGVLFWMTGGVGLLPEGGAAQVPTPPPADSTARVWVREITVEGARRVPAETVLRTARLPENQQLSQADVQAALGRLAETGQYADLRIRTEPLLGGGTRLVLVLQELPRVEAVEVEGVPPKEARALLDTLKLAEPHVMDLERLQALVARLRATLEAEGFSLASFDTTWVPTATAETIRLRLSVERGQRVRIADIDIQGSQKFSEEDLLDVLETKQEGFWWFRRGALERAEWQRDLSARLPEFYARHGYLDFRVLQDSLQVDTLAGTLRLQIRVAEGPQYRWDALRLEGLGELPEVEARTLLLPSGSLPEPGAVFNAVALREGVSRLVQWYRNEGFLAAQVTPRLEPVDSASVNPRVRVVLQAVPGRRFRVGRIEIRGNTYTQEEVIRRQLTLEPGEIYSERRLVESYQRVAGLGFFEMPLAPPDLQPRSDTAVVDIVFQVRETTTGSFNFGAALGGGGQGRQGGVAGFLGYRQPNLFGQGKALDLRGEYGWSRKSLQASYTDPAIAGSRWLGSASLFHMEDEYSARVLAGETTRTGGSLRLGAPLSRKSPTRLWGEYSLSHYSYQGEGEGEQRCVESIFCQPSSLASTAAAGLVHDTRNHPLFPTVGKRSELALAQTGGVLGGDGNFQKLTASWQQWTPLGEVENPFFPSRRFPWTLGSRIEGGAIFGDAERFPLQQFSLGGTRWGAPLRGYEEASITPQGYRAPRSPGVQGADRLGDAYLVASAELALRLHSSLSLSTFAEAGNVWDAAGSIDPTRLFRSVGVGATLVTPFGPVGVDAAYGLDLPSPEWRIHVRMGGS